MNDAPHLTLRAFSTYHAFRRWLQSPETATQAGRRNAQPGIADPRSLQSSRARKGSSGLAAIAAVLFGLMAPAAAAPARILAFGDSLTAGAGVAAEDSLPAQLMQRLLADGYDVEVINAGVSGDTSAMGLARLDYTLSAGPVDLAIVELGANDMLLGLDTKQARANLDTIVTTLKAKGVNVMLAAMTASENYGKAYKKDFDAIFPELAKKHGVAMIPFFMDVVWGHPNLTVDGVHPNAAGVAKIIVKIAPHVEKALASMGVGKTAQRR